MSGTDRRSVLYGAMLAAVAGARATRAVARPAGDAAGPFVPPDRPMLYTRTLQRGLPGGQVFRVERSFAVRFAPLAQGFVVDGRQSEVDVDAPSSLETIAEMERKRTESGLFPLQLDKSGLIDAGPAVRITTGIDRVLAAAREVMERRTLSPAERAETGLFMAEVQQAVAPFFAALPIDLFAPLETRRVAEQVLDVPDGVGTVRVEFTASADPATGLMTAARREIATAIDGDRRVTSEDWTLAPL